jgi:hypothetical protein
VEGKMAFSESSREFDPMLCEIPSFSFYLEFFLFFVGQTRRHTARHNSSSNVAEVYGGIK